MNRLFKICLLLVFSQSVLAQSNDLEIFTTRLQRNVIESTDTTGVQNLYTSIKPDGSWNDVDYADQSRTLWKPLTHLTRLKQMAVAWHLNQEPKLLKAILSGLDFWFDRLPVSDNWWYNDIGQILQLGPLVVLLKGELSDQQIQFSEDILEEPTNENVRTGQNLVWVSAGSIYRGALIDSVALINFAFKNISGTIEISDQEGIKPDFSFHQHGAQLYNGSYGYSFMGDVVKWVWLTRDLEFQFDPVKIKILSGLMLDGTRWMTYRDWMDIAPRGRAFTRPGSGDLNSSIEMLELLQNVDPVRSAEFQHMIRFIKDGGVNPLQGNKYLWESDFMVQQAPRHYFSVRMSSDETVGTEVINSENLKGFWLPFGTHWLVRHTQEYEPIIYAMDWAHLPGLTAPDTTIVVPNGYISQEENMVGGVSTGKAGLAFFTLNKEQTTARKAWLTWGNEILVMAAGINSSHPKPIHSTLNQASLKGIVSVDGSQLQPGDHHLEAVSRLWHDSVGYLLNQPMNIFVANQPQGGSIYSINHSFSKDTVIKPVFKAWIDHGFQPEEARFAYRIIPNLGLGEINNKSAQNPWQIMCNNPDAQSAWNENFHSGGLVVWQPGIYQLGGYQITLDQPASLILSENEGRIYISSPLDVEVNLLVRKGEEKVFDQFIYLNDGKTVGLSYIR